MIEPFKTCLQSYLYELLAQMGGKSNDGKRIWKDLPSYNLLYWLTEFLPFHGISLPLWWQQGLSGLGQVTRILNPEGGALWLQWNFRALITVEEKECFLFHLGSLKTDKTEVSRLTESSETNLIQNCLKTIWNSTSLILSLLTSLLASFDVMMVHNYQKQHYHPAGWLSNCLSASTQRWQLGTLPLRHQEPCK